MQRWNCLRVWAHDAHGKLEVVIERDAFVEQEFRGARVLLRSVIAPALLLPSDKRRPRSYDEE